MRKILLIAISVVLTLSVFVSCDRAGKNTNKNELLFTFDTYEDVREFVFSSRFGRLEVNKDSQYITEGAGSVHAFTYGEFDNTFTSDTFPTISMLAKFPHFASDDFSGFEFIAYDIYNDNDEIQYVKTNIVTLDDNNQQFPTPKTTTQLNPKAWTKVKFDLSDGSVARANDLSNVYSVNIQFTETRKTADPYTPKSYYIDNLIGKQGAQKVYNPVRAEDEIVFFDNISDVNLFTAYGNLDLAIEGSRTYVKQGLFSMKVAGKGQVGLTSAVFGSGILQNADGISIDIYNADNNKINFSFHFSIFNKEKLHDIVYSKSVLVSSNAWQTVTVSKEELAQTFELSKLERIIIEMPSALTFIDNIKII